MSNITDKRRAERISTERPVKIYHHQDLDQGKMIDLSPIGAGIVTDAFVAENETMNIEFHLPNLGPSPLQICGRAVHAYKVRHQYLVGLEFQSLADYTQSQIQEYIQFHHRLD